MTPGIPREIPSEKSSYGFVLILILGLVLTIGLALGGYKLVNFYLARQEGARRVVCLIPEGCPRKSLFDQILSTFKFLPTTSPTQEPIEGRFCGGIAAGLPEYQCPEGYKCHLDGDYPDAGGRCVRKWLGVF